MKNLPIFVMLALAMYFLISEEKFTKNPLPEIEETDVVSTQQIVRIHGLNNFDENSLSEAKELIENNFPFVCEFGESITTKEEPFRYICEDIQRELGNPVDMVYDQNKPIDVFVTTTNLFSLGLDVKGVCYGNQIYVQSYPTFEATLIHELSHIYIYDHCNNECVMNSYSHKRWNSNTNKAVYCDECKSKLPF